MMKRYHKMFQKLKYKKESCFVPFIVIGDPNIKIFYNIIDTLINAGADALELGMPFSDPLADGPIVQNANIRALSNNITISQCFNIVQKVRAKYPKIPIGILIYANLIFNQGIKNFYKICQNIGIDSVLIPDVPVEESKTFRENAKLNKISSIFICPPNANDRLIYKLSKYSTGYIYLISRTGVTGLQNQTNNPDINIIKKIKEYKDIPILHGFGISNPQQIVRSLLIGTNGVICGSIIIQLIEKFYSQQNIMIQKIQQLTQNLKCATRQLTS